MTDPTVASCWRQKYETALFSEDNEISANISAAEEAIAARGRELFEMRGSIVEEIQQLDAARYAMKALRGCVSLRIDPPATLALVEVRERD